MSPPKKTSFQDDWSVKYKFISRVVKDPHSAHCSLCRKSFALSNMGSAAVESHIAGKKHQTMMKSCTGSFDLHLFAAKRNERATGRNSVGPGSPEDPSVDPDDVLPISETASGGSGTKDLQPARTATSATSRVTTAATSTAQGLACSSGNPVSTQIRGAKDFVQKGEVVKAEILWALNTVMGHASLNQAGNSANLFPVMFPDSYIASQIQIGRCKLSYVIVHGLAPYFREELFKQVEKSDAAVIYFDESMNKKNKKIQMDFAVGFWDQEKNRTCVRYYDSAFLGHTKAIDLLEAFLLHCEKTLQLKLLNVSLDGPTVNKKFLKDLLEELEKRHGPETRKFAFMGTCGLHTVNNAFKTGAKGTEWGIVDFIRSAHNVLSSSPARLADYEKYCGSDVGPLPFCAVRWLQNQAAADRALSILPNLKKYVDGVIKDKTESQIKSKSYSTMKEFLKDKLLPPKLAFFSYVFGLLEPFLTEFQTAEPLAPLLYSRLVGIMTDLLKIIVKQDVIDKVSNVSHIILNPENLKGAKDISLSFSVNAELKKLPKTVKEVDILHFKNECRTFVKLLCEKLLEVSPLKYELCRGISCFDPAVIAAHSAGSNMLMKRLALTLTHFQERGWLTPKDCDTIESQYKKLTRNSAVRERCKAFKKSEERLDDFWMSVLSIENFPQLKCLVKRVLLLSHGNAFVERGFSINKEMVVENQKEKSLIGQRMVYDAVTEVGGLLNVDITPKLIQKVRFSRQEYHAALDKERVWLALFEQISVRCSDPPLKQYDSNPSRRPYRTPAAEPKVAEGTSVHFASL